MSTNGLDTILESVGNDVQSMTGLSSELIAANTNLDSANDGTLGGTIDQDFSMPITKGSGEITEKKNTYGVTLKGYFEILSPDNGTWSIKAEVAGKTVVNKGGVTKGEQIPFTAETNFWSKTTVDIKATWSEQSDTTLKIHLHATY